MESEVLFDVATWVIAAAVLVAGVGVSELASRLGQRWRSELDATAQRNLNTIETALLGLIGLLLAFTLNMSVTRFDMRRELMVDEVNAIGTAWLRSGLFPEPTRSILRNRLRDYAAQRVELFESAHYRLARESTKGQSLRDAIWKDASVVATGDPHSIQAGLLIQSVNNVIDLNTKRDVANNSHVPELVWWLLIVVTLLAMTAVGFNGGEGSKSNLGARILLAFALSVTLALTLDLDRPRRGVIRVSQAPMRELHDSLGREP